MHMYKHILCYSLNTVENAEDLGGVDFFLFGCAHEKSSYIITHVSIALIRLCDFVCLYVCVILS